MIGDNALMVTGMLRSLSDYADCLRPSDYTYRDDIPSDASYAGPSHLGYYDLKLSTPATYPVELAPMTYAAIREHETTHFTLANSTAAGVLAAECLRFADTLDDRHAKRRWVAIATLLHDASIYVHESAATFAEIQALHVGYEVPEDVIEKHIEGLPPFYRRVYNATEAIMGTGPDSHAKGIVEREIGSRLPFADRERSRVYLAAVLRIERRWKSIAVKQLALLALRTDLASLFDFPSEIRLWRLRLRCLQETHSPTRRYRRLLSRLKDANKMASLYDCYRDAARRYATKIASRFRNFEELLAADERTLVFSEVPDERIAELLDFGLPFVNTTAASLEKLHSRMVAFFAPDSSEANWWTGREVCFASDESTVARSFSSASIACLPRLRDGPFQAWAQTQFGAAPLRYYSHVLITKNLMLEGADGILACYDHFALVRQIPLTGNSERTKYFSIGLRRSETAEFLATFDRTFTSLSIEADLLTDREELAYWTTVCNGLRFFITINGIANIMVMSAVDDRIHVLYGACFHYYTLGHLTPNTIVLAAISEEPRDPPVWSVVDTKLLGALRRGPSSDEVHEAGPDVVHARGIAGALYEAAYHWYYPEAYTFTPIMLGAVVALDNDAWGGICERVRFDR